MIKNTEIKKILNNFKDKNQLLGDRFINDNNEYLEQLLFIYRCWSEEINNEKQSIYIAGKTSSGKTTFINYILDNDRDILPEKTSICTKVILKIEHSEKCEAIIYLKKKELPIYMAKSFNTKNNSEICMSLIKNLDINKFHLLLNKTDNYNPVDYINSVSLFYPLKYFSDFIIYDTPGLNSAENETDKLVEEFFLNHSFIFWFFDASNYEQSNAIKILENYENLLSKIHSKKLILLGSHYDILIENDSRDSFRKDAPENIKKKYGLSNRKDRKEIKNDICVYSKNKIIEEAKKHKIKISFLEFIDLKHKKYEENINRNKEFFFLLYRDIIKNFRFSEIDNLDNYISIIIEIRDFQIRELEKYIEETQKITIEKEKETKNIEKKKENINQSRKDTIEKVESLFKDFRDSINHICEKFDKLKMSKKDYNKQIGKLEKYINSEGVKNIVQDKELNNKFIYKSLKKKISFKQFKEIDFSSLISKNIIGITAYKRKKIKSGLNSPNLRELKVNELIEKQKENMIKTVEKEFNKQSSVLEKVKNGYDEEIKNFRKKIGNLNKEKNEIKKKFLNLSDFLQSLKNDYEKEIEQWKIPSIHINKQKKLESFLELYKNLKYIENIENFQKEQFYE